VFWVGAIDGDVFDIRYYLFHGWIIASPSGQNKGKVWGHLVPEVLAGQAA
jgi:hypothetical protein